MDDTRAAELLETERKEVVALLNEISVAGENDREGANEQGDMADSEESLTGEEQESAVAEGLRLRLAAIERAQQRLRDGTTADPFAAETLSPRSASKQTPPPNSPPTRR